MMSLKMITLSDLSVQAMNLCARLTETLFESLIIILVRRTVEVVTPI